MYEKMSLSVLVYFITGNRNKFEEVAAIWDSNGCQFAQKNVALQEIQSLDVQSVIAAKLDEAHALFPSAFIVVEDTSLDLMALQGKGVCLPGPFIKFFMETIGNEGLVKLADSFDNHAACAVSSIGLVDPHGKKAFFEERLAGRIVPPCSSGRDFGWDGIFEPTGQQGKPRVFAQMSIEEKNAFSMRGKAAQKACAYYKRTYIE